uniref:Uncharacterized protein n=1 Tax=Arundo donax TaxID=35708 RepID=A0A0A9F9P3_ARUDO
MMLYLPRKTIRSLVSAILQMFASTQTPKARAIHTERILWFYIKALLQIGVCFKQSVALCQ